MQLDIQKILVPVDGSSHAMRAAEYAVRLALRLNCEILLINTHRPFPVALGEPYYQKAINKILDQADSLLEPYRTLLQSSGVRFTDRVLEGAAGEVIPQVAAIEKCDMIVMGCRGHSNLEGLLLGSVTHRVLSSAPCPVLVVR
jgi:nucleotide-binding universal stress UspA family protein